MLNGTIFPRSRIFATAAILLVGITAPALAEDDCQRARTTFANAIEVSQTDDFVKNPIRLSQILTATDDAGFYVKVWCEDRTTDHVSAQRLVRSRLEKALTQLTTKQVAEHCTRSQEDAVTSIEQSEKFLAEDKYSSARIEASIAQSRYQRLMSHCPKSDPQFYIADMNTAQSLNRLSTCRELSELATLTMMHGDVLKSRAGLGSNTPQTAKAAYLESAEFLNRAIGYCSGGDKEKLTEKMVELDRRRGIKRRVADGETTTAIDTSSWYSSWATGGEDDDNDF